MAGEGVGAAARWVQAVAKCTSLSAYMTQQKYCCFWGELRVLLIAVEVLLWSKWAAKRGGEISLIALQQINTKQEPYVVDDTHNGNG